MHDAVAGEGTIIRRGQAALKDAGVEIIAPLRATPFDRFFFKDPNGYMIEIIDQETLPADDVRRGYPTPTILVRGADLWLNWLSCNVCAATTLSSASVVMPWMVELMASVACA